MDIFVDSIDLDSAALYTYRELNKWLQQHDKITVKIHCVRFSIQVSIKKDGLIWQQGGYISKEKFWVRFQPLEIDLIEGYMLVEKGEQKEIPKPKDGDFTKDGKFTTEFMNQLFTNGPYRVYVDSKGNEEVLPPYEKPPFDDLVF